MSFAALAIALAFGPGCKGKPSGTQQAPANVETPGTAAATFAGSGGALAMTDTISKDQQKDIVLPRETHTAPQPTSAPLTLEQIKAIAAERFDEWSTEVRFAGPKGTELHHTTKSRPFVLVTVHVLPCTPEACVPMGDAKWTTPSEPGARPLVDALFSEVLRKEPSSQHEAGSADVYGDLAMYEYHLGYANRTEGGLTYSHAYTLYYNDGKNAIRVSAEYQDLPPKSQELLGKLVSKTKLELIGRAFLDHYTHIWTGERPGEPMSAGSGSGSGSGSAKPVGSGSGSAKPAGSGSGSGH